MPIKVIFLDIDGVMTPARSYFDRNPSFDPLAVKTINRLVERTGAHVVLNSTWNSKFKHTDELAEFLNSVGLVALYFDMTSYAKLGFSRAVSIAAHLGDLKKNFGAEQIDWVSLGDDWSLNEEYPENSIRVDPLNGISVENYRQATKILGNPDPFVVLM